MNIEITDLDMILNYLETTSLEPHDDYSSEFTYKDQKILYKYIKQLQQENEKLTGVIQTYDILLKANVEENKQLKDNWNKLKEYCKENTLCYEVGDDENTKLIGSKIHGLNVLDKMQELEQGSDSNE